MTPGLIPAGATLLAVAVVRQARGQPPLLAPPAPPALPFDPDAVRFYFHGIWSDSGHHWRPAKRYLADKTPYAPTGCPFAPRGESVDGTLCRYPVTMRDTWNRDYRAEQIEGLARLHHKDGWTAVAYWDRSSKDTRYGCNTAFVAEGLHSFDRMLDLARHHFPHVIARTVGKFEIRLETP